MSNLIIILTIWALANVALSVGLILWQRAFLRRYEAAMVDIVKALAKEYPRTTWASTDNFTVTMPPIHEMKLGDEIVGRFVNGQWIAERDLKKGAELTVIGNIGNLFGD